jgi:hypothetical protein
LCTFLMNSVFTPGYVMINIFGHFSGDIGDFLDNQ